MKNCFIYCAVYSTLIPLDFSLNTSLICMGGINCRRTERERGAYFHGWAQNKNNIRNRVKYKRYTGYRFRRGQITERSTRPVRTKSVTFGFETHVYRSFDSDRPPSCRRPLTVILRFISMRPNRSGRFFFLQNGRALNGSRTLNNGRETYIRRLFLIGSRYFSQHPIVGHR